MALKKYGDVESMIDVEMIDLCHISVNSPNQVLDKKAVRQLLRDLTLIERTMLYVEDCAEQK
jgi:hypothetical protein